MKKLHYFFHVVTYYVAWLLCIHLAAKGYAWLSSLTVIACVTLQIFWQYKIQHQTRGLWRMIGLMVVSSTLVDSLLIASGIIIYAANPFAPYVTSPWMIMMWVSFAVNFYTIMHGLFGHLIILAILSFTGFASAFAIGAKMGAVSFPFGYNTCFLIGAIWLILLPSITFFYKKSMDII